MQRYTCVQGSVIQVSIVEYKRMGFNLHAFVFSNHVQEAGS
jgi:hypothetical protein